MSRKLLQRVGRVRIYRDSDTREYVVVADGSEYFTDDKQDAVDTANAILNDKHLENPGARLKYPIYSYFSAQTAYHDAHRGRGRGKIGNNTTIMRPPQGGEGYSVVLHHTPIVTYRPDGSVQLRSGGHESATTKARMNEVLPPGWGVSQKNFRWSVHTPKGAYNFIDGMVIQEDGTVTADEFMRLTDHTERNPKRLSKDRHDAMYPKYQMEEWEYNHLLNWLASGRAPIGLSESEDPTEVRRIASGIQRWLATWDKSEAAAMIENRGWPGVFDEWRNAQ